MVNLETRIGHDTVVHLIQVRIGLHELLIFGEKPIEVERDSVHYTRAWMAQADAAIRNVSLSIAEGRVSALITVAHDADTKAVEDAIRTAQTDRADPRLAFDLTFQRETAPQE